MKPRLLTIAVAATLAGCAAVGPDYTRPAIVLPAQYPQAQDSSAQLTANWWTQFDEPELTRLIDKALAANADIAQAVARVEFADAQLREAGGALVPTVNAGGNASRSEIGASVPSNPSGRTVTGNDFKLSLSTSFEKIGRAHV